MAWLTGYPREQVRWFPTKDTDKCVKCGMYLNSGKNVYDWTEKGAVVARPYPCVVGCTTCSNLCLGNAITFQNIDDIRNLYKKEGLWAKVKRQLKEEGKLKING